MYRGLSFLETVRFELQMLWTACERTGTPRFRSKAELFDIEQCGSGVSSTLTRNVFGGIGVLWVFFFKV